MAIKSSTGIRNALLASGSLRAQLNLGTIRIFSGAAPASADDAETGVLLCVITEDSTATGLSLDVAAVNGLLFKDSAAWSGVCLSTGTASYYRHVGPADTGVLSTSEPRLQGTTGTIGADMNFTSTALVLNASQAIDYYTIGLPTA